MGKTISNVLTLLLALAGCIVSIVLTWEHFHPQADIGCSVFGGDCHATVDSAYGHVGPIPTSLFGLVMYLTIAAICIQRMRVISAARARRSQDIGTLPSTATADSPDAGEHADAARAELNEAAGSPTPDYSTPDGVREGRLLTRAEETLVTRLDAAVLGISILALGISWWLQYVSIGVVHSFCPWCLSSALIVTTIFALSCYRVLIYGRSFNSEQKLLGGVLAFVFVMGSMLVVGPVLGWIEQNLAPPPKRGDLEKPDLKKVVLGRTTMPIKGDPKAQLFIVEFADYQCSHCKEASDFLDRFMKQNPNKIRLGYRNFPLPVHKYAEAAAVAAEAAAEQGKFWQMHDMIFSHQKEMELPTFSVEQIGSWAEMLSLDMQKFNKDRENPSVYVRVQQDMENARFPLRVMVTPTFYVITGDNMYSFSGDKEMIAALNDPNNKIWK